MSGARAPCGLIGKTPGAGDFLRLNLPAAAAAALDAWLDDGLGYLASQDEDWRTGFLAAAAWRFLTTESAAGPAALAGVVAPSRDRVGRPFPCVALAVLDDVTPTSAVACTPWFDRAEAALDGVTVEELKADLAELGAPRPDDLDVLSLRARSTDDGLFLDVRSGPDGRAVTLQAVLETSPLPYGASLFWRHTDGGANVLITPGLPRRAAFVALFRPPANDSAPRRVRS